MISDSTTLNSLFLNAQGHDDHAADNASVNSTDIYDCYLQDDNYDDSYGDLEELEEDKFFESSQLHHLAQTQPVQMIEEQDLVAGLPYPQEILVEQESQVIGISPMLTSRSSSLSSTFSNRNSAYGYAYEGLHENTIVEDENSIGVGKVQPLFAALSSICNSTNQYEDSRAPRSFAVYESALDIGAEINQYTSNESYHYAVHTNSGMPSTRYATDEEIEFVKCINSKLSRYAGYFTAGSKDQEYSDKVRFQEISYKFSKTYV